MKTENSEAPVKQAAEVSLRQKRRKRPDIVADQIRERIIETELMPGDRVPSDWMLPETMGVSRGTLREALKILEFQGLVSTKTGPGGGVFVAAIAPVQAIQLLDNLFLFKPASIAGIYAIRKLLEPELAASVVGNLSPQDFEVLQSKIRLYEEEPKTAEEEYQQRLAELDFHAELARYSENTVLCFICTFLLSLLRDMTACRAIYKQPNPALRETGIHYQVKLLRAIKGGDRVQARQIMREHMSAAEIYMLERAELRRTRRTGV